VNPATGDKEYLPRVRQHGVWATVEQPQRSATRALQLQAELQRKIDAEEIDETERIKAELNAGYVT